MISRKDPYKDLSVYKDNMVSGKTAGRRIFIRYSITNLLILIIPFLLAGIYYSKSYRVLLNGVDTLAETRLSQSLEDLENLFQDIQKMSSQLTNDYAVTRYLNNDSAFTDIEIYNMKDLASRLSSYVLSNYYLSHCLLYLSSTDYVIYENGFSSYERFYGGFFKTGNFSAEDWSWHMHIQNGKTIFLPDQMVRLGGSPVLSHIFLKPIGQDSYFRGTLVLVLDRKSLDTLLSGLPEKYGGWAFLQDEKGQILASSMSDPDPFFSTLPAEKTPAVLKHKGETYRIYRMVSPLSGWISTAVLNETLIFGSLRSLRNMAFFLLTGGFVLALFISFLLAFTNTRPLERLMNQVLRNAGDITLSPDIFGQVESALTQMEQERQTLRSEVKNSERIARIYFFQNLLRGNIRSRMVFDQQVKLYDIKFPENPCQVVVCRLMALHAAGDTEVFARLRDALTRASEGPAGSGEFSFPVSFDDMAFILPCKDDNRREIIFFTNRLLDKIPAAIRGHFAFGVGLPCTDSFLLSQSHQQAVAAVNSLPAVLPQNCFFYDDIPVNPDRYHYPLEEEAGIIQAVRIGSTDLVVSLINSLKEENYNRRKLSSRETDHFNEAFRGTLQRLLAELSGNQAKLLSCRNEKTDSHGIVSFNAMTELLMECTALRDQCKKSHNSRLVDELNHFIHMNYSRYDLGLGLLASEFHLSENYLSNFFKEQTGECLSVFILRCRMEAAMKMLRQPSLPVTVIARDCGYTSSPTFRRAFKRFTGFTPSEYRINKEGNKGEGD